MVDSDSSEDEKEEEAEVVDVEEEAPPQVRRKSEVLYLIASRA